MLFQISCMVPVLFFADRTILQYCVPCTEQSTPAQYYHLQVQHLYSIAVYVCQVEPRGDPRCRRVECSEFRL